MFRNFTKQAQVTWSNDPRVLMHFLKRLTFLHLYVIEINAFQHNTVTRIITSWYIWQTTCIPQQSYTVELMFTEVQMHNVGEKAKSMLITRKIPKTACQKACFCHKKHPKSTRSLYGDQVDKEMSTIQTTINNADNTVLDIFIPQPMSWCRLLMEKCAVLFALELCSL